MLWQKILNEEERKMPSGKEVRPEKWGEVLELYDDGNYSAIWSSYDALKTQKRPEFD